MAVRIVTNPHPAPRVLLVCAGAHDAIELRSALELGAALRKKRVVVTVATHAKFRSLVKESGGLGFADAGLCPLLARRSTAEGKAVDSADPAQLGKALHAFMGCLVQSWFDRGLELVAGSGGREAPASDGAHASKVGSLSPDVVLLCTPASVAVYSSLCDEYCVAYGILDQSPCVATAAFPPPKAFRGVAAVHEELLCLGGWAIHSQSTWRFLFRDHVNACRAGIGMEPYAGLTGPLEGLGTRTPTSPLVLHAYLPELLPRPREWGSHVHVIGLCAGGLGPLPEADAGGTCLPDTVRAFFAADTTTPVVLLTLGTIGDLWSDAAGRTTLLVQCLEAFTSAKCRAIVVTPASTKMPGEFTVDGYRVMSLPALPLGSELVLCRKCAAVVCAGDPWTLQVALRAGTPVVPLRLSGGSAAHNTEQAAESEFWGRVACAKGLTPAPLVAANLTVSSLCRAVKRAVRVDSPEARAALDLAAAIRASPANGMALGVKLVTDLAAPIAAVRAAAAKADMA